MKGEEDGDMIVVEDVDVADIQDTSMGLVEILFDISVLRACPYVVFWVGELLVAYWTKVMPSSSVESHNYCQP